MQKTTWIGAWILALAVAGASVALAQAAGKTAPEKTSEKMLTATGTISKLQAADHRLTVSVSGLATPFVWTPQTRINGTLSQGARVTVRYTTLTDGQNVARQISVLR